MMNDQRNRSRISIWPVYSVVLCYFVISASHDVYVEAQFVDNGVGCFINSGEGAMFSASKGEFGSERIPGTTCVWTIEVPNAEKIVISFIRFEIQTNVDYGAQVFTSRLGEEKYDSFAYVPLLVDDLPWNASTGLPRDIVVQGNATRILYIHGNAAQPTNIRGGFQASYKAVVTGNGDNDESSPSSTVSADVDEDTSTDDSVVNSAIGISSDDDSAIAAISLVLSTIAFTGGFIAVFAFIIKRVQQKTKTKTPDHYSSSTLKTQRCTQMRKTPVVIAAQQQQHTPADRWIIINDTAADDGIRSFSFINGMVHGSPPPWSHCHTTAMSVHNYSASTTGGVSAYNLGF